MKKILFHTSDYGYLAEKILSKGDFESGEVKVEHFSDDERYQRILTDVSGLDVVLLGGTINDGATLELYDLASAIVGYGANSLSLIVPYFGYSTMERAVQKGEVVTAKTRARLLSTIPSSYNGNRIFLFDLHTEGLPHYFENNLRAVHVYCKSIIMDAAKAYGGDDFVLASTDAGRAKWVESLANDLGVNAAFVLKRRISGDQTEISAINADVSGKTVIIYDDMIRSGGSIVNAARVYKEAGASKIFVITTHGLFIGNGLQKIKQSGLVEKVIACDTHANVNSITDDFLEIRTVEPLITSLF
ncbi:ribose-phosphate pyrophosphokinase [Fulvivirga sp. RKSG066]|uniref:ribose-phosphate diphosphokinase n=1 Tax=Fulvivirga aurantia TaxID=2529383 RepID=UPI0012BB8554|nr:ribose-phosphate diphosphokinase [Fulvivirga aurantia]MTI22948.1 ribose-phosphate pyrophosphokinase [Fulvivirga aurantia]